jgi:hypothetical protein
MLTRNLIRDLISEEEIRSVIKLAKLQTKADYQFCLNLWESGENRTTSYIHGYYRPILGVERFYADISHYSINELTDELNYLISQKRYYENERLYKNLPIISVNDICDPQPELHTYGRAIDDPDEVEITSYVEFRLDIVVLDKKLMPDVINRNFRNLLHSYIGEKIQKHDGKKKDNLNKEIYREISTRYLYNSKFENPEWIQGLTKRINEAYSFFVKFKDLKSRL